MQRRVVRPPLLGPRRGLKHRVHKALVLKLPGRKPRGPNWLDLKLLERKHLEPWRAHLVLELGPMRLLLARVQSRKRHAQPLAGVVSLLRQRAET